MYEEDHGIIHNRFFDTKLQKLITFGKKKYHSLIIMNFFIGTRDEGQWADPRIEPIWITATKQVENFLMIFDLIKFI